MSFGYVSFGVLSFGIMSFGVMSFGVKSFGLLLVYLFQGNLSLLDYVQRIFNLKKLSKDRTPLKAM